MKALRLLASRWVLSFVGVAILALLVWFFGPLLPLLDRIGLALKEEIGPVKVIGYTDDQPIRTIAFPSNFQLSLARADAASKIIATTIGDPKRLSAEGKADADPIAPNTTPEGRERNRRIEIVLIRQDA